MDRVNEIIGHLTDEEYNAVLYGVMRIDAMKWWNNLSSLRKTQICDTNTETLGVARRWETLTVSEIERLRKYYA